MMVENMDLLMEKQKDAKMAKKQVVSMVDDKVALRAHKMVHITDKMMDNLKEYGSEAQMEVCLEQLTDNLLTALQALKQDWKVDLKAASLASSLVVKKAFFVAVQMAATRVVDEMAVLLVAAWVASLVYGLD